MGKVQYKTVTLSKAYYLNAIAIDKNKVINLPLLDRMKFRGSYNQ
jgi:hypothetical protein